MALNLDAVRSFVKVAELASFSRAAEQLGLPKARVSQHIRKLEAELGTKLLQRTTRVVTSTADGESFLHRARGLLSETDDAASMFQPEKVLRGRVRLDGPVTLVRDVLLPRLPAFLAQHPHLELLVSSTDRIVDVVRDGFDGVVRVGALTNSDLTAKRLGELELINCAAPSYLRTYGTPRNERDLEDHFVVHYSLSLGHDTPEFEWLDRGKVRNRRMRCLITVNNVDALRGACLAGLGIAQVARAGVADWLREGRLVEVLPNHLPPALPITLLHPHGRTPPRRVRVVLDWVAGVVTRHFAAPAPR